MRADLIHCNEIYPNPYAVRAAASVAAPAGSPCEGRPIPVITHVRLDMKEGMIRKYDLALADRIVVPSEALGHEFDEWEDKAQRVRVIYNGVNLQEYCRTRTPAAARLQIGVPPDGPLLAAIGQVGPRKGGDVILDAFERLAANHPTLRLMFVGDPHRGQEPFAEELKTRAARPPLAGRVHFFPCTEAVAEVERLCREIAREFPQAIFFIGKVIFQTEKWYHRFLH
ncbi:MAG: glycosyltransferase, partial [bacterium]|nr:glycosyltransferase [bacterium]